MNINYVSILKPRSNDRNMLTQHCWVQQIARVWPPCYDMLRRVGCCSLKFDHFQTRANVYNTQQVATHRNTVAKRPQNVAPNSVAICCVGMFLSFGRGLMIG